jgi:hypothetical protein
VQLPQNLGFSVVQILEGFPFASSGGVVSSAIMSFHRSFIVIVNPRVMQLLLLTLRLWYDELDDRYELTCDRALLIFEFNVADMVEDM